MGLKMIIVGTSVIIAFTETVKIKLVLVFLILFFLFTITNVQEINYWV